MIFDLGERRIHMAADSYVADSARVIGSVRLGSRSSVWFNAVLRGDSEWIEVGDETNVQDGVVIHADLGVPTVLGRGVTIGHMALLHGCVVADNSMIGNGAIVLDGVRIGEHCIIAAGSLITPRTIIPDGVLVMGSPGRVVRETSDADRARIRHASSHYVENAQRFRQLLRPHEEHERSGS